MTQATEAQYRGQQSFGWNVNCWQADTRPVAGLGWSTHCQPVTHHTPADTCNSVITRKLS